MTDGEREEERTEPFELTVNEALLGACEVCATCVQGGAGVGECTTVTPGALIPCGGGLGSTPGL